MFFPIPVETPESPRVQELSQRIQELIHDFQHELPMTPAEVRQALRSASAGAVGRSRVPFLGTILFWLVVIALPILFWAILGAVS